jgi:hypothetical protein
LVKWNCLWYNRHFTQMSLTHKLQYVHALAFKLAQGFMKKSSSLKWEQTQISFQGIWRQGLSFASFCSQVVYLHSGRYQFPSIQNGRNPKVIARKVAPSPVHPARTEDRGSDSAS